MIQVVLTITATPAATTGSFINIEKNSILNSLLTFALTLVAIMSLRTNNIMTMYLNKGSTTLILVRIMLELRLKKK